MPNYKPLEDCTQIRVTLCGEIRQKLMEIRQKETEKKKRYQSLEKIIISILRDKV
jgi:hypothetical protein